MRRSRLAWLLAATLALAVLLGISAMRDTIAVGVHVAGMDVGGRTIAEARRVLAPAATAFGSTLVVVADGERVWVATNEELGIRLDTDRAAALAFDIGRDGDVPERVRDVIGTLIRGTDLGWPQAVAGTRLDAFVEHIATDVDAAPVDGAVTITASGVEVRTPVTGRRVDRTLLRDAVLDATDKSVVVTLPTVVIEPVLDATAIADASRAAIAAYRPLRTVAGSEAMTIPAARIGQVLAIVRDASGDGDRLRLAVDPTGMSSLVDEIASTLDGPALNASLLPGRERLEVVSGRDGVTVDRSAAKTALEAAILGGDTADVTVPASIAPADVPTAEARRIADSTQLAGGFTTYFPENWARATNIGRAAETFDGMLVEPGQSFSFWDRIGAVTPATGYVSAGAIIGGVSQSAIGGGLCQVSTTLFNAVARGGYQIDQRQPHSYYIERYPLGLDAAVFAPSVDLEWTNDTGTPAYIRAAATATSVSFWIYSAPTGRTTTFSEPVEANLRWPYAGQPADPAHAPGYVVLGRDVWVTRSVVENGTEVRRDTFFSHYAPVWGGPG
jgi:vancomycin resistance protein YoaR